MITAVVAALILPHFASADGHNIDAGWASEPHTAVELNSTALVDTLSKLPASSPVLMEFFASWCPACKHFAPEYEKIAAFLKHNTVGGQQLFVGRVDCAVEVETCGGFRIEAYPSVYLGTAEQFLVPAKYKHLLRYTAFTRNAKAIVEWVGEQLKAPVKYVEVPPAGSPPPETKGTSPAAQPAVASKGTVWDLRDVEGATLQLYSIIAHNPLLHTGAAKRQALRDVLRMWAVAHASARCRVAADHLHARFDTLWPETETVAPEAVRQYKICGERATFDGWVSCKGSKPDTRGYSCGLWLLLHTAAHRLPEPGAAELMMTFLRSFNTHFFQCEPCQKHFARMLEAQKAKDVKTRADVVRWLWEAHNEVNARLAVIESKYGHSTTGDAAFPKLQWPTEADCPACRSPARRGGDGSKGEGAAAATQQEEGGSWNPSAVMEYLTLTYGHEASSQASAEALQRQDASISEEEASARPRTDGRWEEL